MESARRRLSVSGAISGLGYKGADEPRRPSRGAAFNLRYLLQKAFLPTYCAKAAVGWRMTIGSDMVRVRKSSCKCRAGDTRRRRRMLDEATGKSKSSEPSDQSRRVTAYTMAIAGEEGEGSTARDTADAAASVTGADVPGGDAGRADAAVDGKAQRTGATARGQVQQRAGNTRAGEQIQQRAGRYCSGRVE
jgi:hypothetical protein